jgi:hypothetical protein
MRLAVGTKVKMSLNGRICFMNHRENPHDIVGTVLEVERKKSHGYVHVLDCLVEWENGWRNTYDYVHLEPLIDISSKSLEDYL